MIITATPAREYRLGLRVTMALLCGFFAFFALIPIAATLYVTGAWDWWLSFFLLPVFMTGALAVVFHRVSDETVKKLLIKAPFRYFSGPQSLLHPVDALHFLSVTTSGINTNVQMLFRVNRIPWTAVATVVAVSVKTASAFKPDLIGLRLAITGEHPKLDRYEVSDLPTPFTHEIWFEFVGDLDQTVSDLTDALLEYGREKRALPAPQEQLDSNAAWDHYPHVV
ncbi:MAG: hypothetical protein FWG47_01565 [Propionibacteriaceae bacterium]|nr:hypothetical protein [Propionibacteriaceae bacterium]